MATTKKTESDTVTVEVAGGKRESFTYEYEVIDGGDMADAIAHANSKGKNESALAEAYFRIVNTTAKSTARQAVVNENLDPKVKAKKDAIRTMANALGWSKEEAAAKFAELAGEEDAS